MAKGHDKRFIKIAAPGGGWNYIEIDPNRPPRGVSLYAKDPQNQGRYLAVAGIEQKRILDCKSLIQLTEDMLGELDSDLDNFGEAGEVIRVQILNSLDLKGLLASLCEGDLENTEGSLREMLYRLRSGACALAKELSETQVSVRLHAETVSGLAVALDKSDDMVINLYVAWAAAAEELLRIKDRVESFERELANIVEQVKVASLNWQKTIDANNEPIRRALAQLYDPDSDTDFTSLAYSLRGKPLAIKAHQTSLDQAKAAVRVCRDAERHALGLWQSAKALVGRLIVDRPGEIRRLSDEFENRRETFIAATRQMPLGTAKPYDLGEGKNLLTREQYTIAEEIVADDKHWSRAGIEQRLRDLRDELIQLTENGPAFDQATLYVIEQAESILGELDKTLITAEPKPVTVASMAAGPVIRQLASRKATLSSAVVEPAQLEKFYELAQCIAYATTCDDRYNVPLAGTQLSAVLDIIVRLGQAESQEIKVYGAALLARIESELTVANSETSILTGWRNCRTRWFKYQVKRREKKHPDKFRAFEYFRFSPIYKSEAESLLHKHGLSSRNIKRIREQRSAERIAAYKSRPRRNG